MKLMFKYAHLILDNWNRESHPLSRDEFGVWSIRLENRQKQYLIPHGSKVKVV